MMRYELMVGLRYLRARRKEAFISLITVISVVGVMIGVMTLNIVLAVMTAYARVLGRSLGSGIYFIGPMAKQHRMATLSGACVIATARAVKKTTVLTSAIATARAPS